jgi:hypothetical protein
MWTRFTIHRDSLAAKELHPKLSEVMNTMLKTMIYIKAHPLKSRYFADLCEETGHGISHSCFAVILAGCQGLERALKATRVV